MTCERLPWGVETRCPCGAINTTPYDSLSMVHWCPGCSRELELPPPENDR